MPARPESGRESISAGAALQLAACDGAPIPATRADPDRPLGEIPGPRTVPDQSGFDPSVPHSARVYGCWLGGKDNYEADRKAAAEVARLRPHVVAGARANRAFLARVVRYLARNCRIRQFLDLGTGLPTAVNTHDIAQEADLQARIVYVDNDPIVLSHARALLVSTPPGVCDYLQADLRDPEGVLAQAARTLDFTQPAVVLLLAVLHFLSDDEYPAGVVAKLAGGLAPGSYLVISHLTADFAAEPVAAAVTAYNAQVPVPVTARTHAQVTGLFGGLPLIEPGVVPVAQWRPVVAGLPHRMTADLYAGVASVPGGHQ